MNEILNRNNPIINIRRTNRENSRRKQKVKINIKNSSFFQ